jgi:hypothetical protein
MTAQRFRIPAGIDREHLLQHLSSDSVRHHGGEMRPKPIQFWYRPAMRWPFDASLDPTTPGTVKSGKWHRYRTQKRCHHMVAVVLHAENAATSSAIRSSNGTAPGLTFCFARICDFAALGGSKLLAPAANPTFCACGCQTCQGPLSGLHAVSCLPVVRCGSCAGSLPAGSCESLIQTADRPSHGCPMPKAATTKAARNPTAPAMSVTTARRNGSTQAEWFSSLLSAKQHPTRYRDGYGTLSGRNRTHVGRAWPCRYPCRAQRLTRLAT